TEFRAVGFAFQQAACRGEDFPRELRRRRERMRPRANAKIGSFQLQRRGRAGQRLFLEASGNLLRLRPEDPFERAEIGYVAVERGLRGHALGLTVGADLALVDAAGKPGE